FGGGEFLEPIRVIIAGRITYSYKGNDIPVNEILSSSVKNYFKERFPLVDLEHDIKIENKLTDYPGPGTIKNSKGAIASMFSPKDKVHVRGYEKLVANDTSYCIAYSPYSELETAVLRVEKFLNDKKTKVKFKWLGSDIKIMAVRNQKKIGITLCIPQIAKYVHSLTNYKNNLETIGRIIEGKFKTHLPKHSIDISINTKDDYEKLNVYLTVSGASLSGDIGVVGRGNRANGLITSNRPMSMEGVNGKNPRYYSGFIYSVVTKKISSKLYKKTGKSNIVEIVSQNGGPLDKPWLIRVVTLADKAVVYKVVNSYLDKVQKITSEFIDGKLINH
ncbi:MAG: S-adenosylmethionine synthetase, partial [bacterium]